MRSSPRELRPGVSALQLVVVLGILLFLMAMLVPAVQKVREAAARTQSVNNVKQMTLAMHAYHDTFKSFPPAVGEAANQRGPTHFHILPFIDQNAVHNAAEGASWKHGTYGLIIPLYLDPRDESLPSHIYRDWLATTNYPVNWLVTKEGKMRINNIPDGTSNTLLFAQRYQICNGQPTAWGYPSIYPWAPMFAYYSDSGFQSAPPQDRCDPARAQSISRDIIIGLCDGSVRTLAPSVTPLMWHYLCDPADGHPINLD